MVPRITVTAVVVLPNGSSCSSMLEWVPPDGLDASMPEEVIARVAAGTLSAALHGVLLQAARPHEHDEAGKELTPPAT